MDNNLDKDENESHEDDESDLNSSQVNINITVSDVIDEELDVSEILVEEEG